MCVLLSIHLQKQILVRKEIEKTFVKIRDGLNSQHLKIEI